MLFLFSRLKDETITPMSHQIGLQFMNCIEGLMYYCLKSHNANDASTVSKIMRLYKHYKKCLEELEVSIQSYNGGFDLHL